MPISIDLPADLEQMLRQQVTNLDQEAKEALLIDLYRQEKLTQFQLSQALGLSKFEVDGLLKRHKVYYDITAEDVAREAEGLGKLREEHARRR